MKIVFFLILKLWFSPFAGAAPSPESFFKNVASPKPSQDVSLLTLQILNSSQSLIIQLNAKEKFIALALMEEGKKLHQEKFTLSNIGESSRPIALLASLMFTFGRSDSRFMSQFLEKQNIGYLPDVKLLNREKVALFEKYQRYLDAIRKNQSWAKNLVSPLTSADVEEQKKIRAIMYSQYYLPSSAVTLIPFGKTYFYQMKLGDATFNLSDDTRELFAIEFPTSEGLLSLKTGGRMAIDGLQNFPSSFLIQMEGKSYEIAFKELNHFPEAKLNSWWEKNVSSKALNPTDVPLFLR